MPIETRVTFPSGDASINLVGRFHLPDGPGPFPAAIICHPYPPAGGSMEVPLVQTIARTLAKAGIAALRFNFRGVGGSEGSFDDGPGEVDDVAGALDWLIRQPEVALDRLAVIGYSFGAAVALAQAARETHRHAMALIGLPFDMMESLPNPGARDWLLVAGEGDTFCPPSRLHTFSLELAGTVNVHILDHADHFLFGHEAEVAETVVNFLHYAV